MVSTRDFLIAYSNALKAQGVTIPIKVIVAPKPEPDEYIYISVLNSADTDYNVARADSQYFEVTCQIVYSDMNDPSDYLETLDNVITVANDKTSYLDTITINNRIFMGQNTLDPTESNNKIYNISTVRTKFIIN